MDYFDEIFPKKQNKGNGGTFIKPEWKTFLDLDDAYDLGVLDKIVYGIDKF